MDKTTDSFKLVLQPAARASTGDFVLIVRDGHVTRKSHARVSAYRLHVGSPQEKLCMQVFCCVQGPQNRRQPAESTQGARNGHVCVPHFKYWKATVSSGVICYPKQIRCFQNMIFIGFHLNLLVSHQQLMYNLIRDILLIRN